MPFENFARWCFCSFLLYLNETLLYMQNTDSELGFLSLGRAQIRWHLHIFLLFVESENTVFFKQQKFTHLLKSRYKVPRETESDDKSVHLLQALQHTWKLARPTAILISHLEQVGTKNFCTIVCGNHSYMLFSYMYRNRSYTLANSFATEYRKINCL